MKTESEIWRAYEYCNSEPCGPECPYYDRRTNCRGAMLEDAMSLMKKLREENHAMRTELAVNTAPRGHKEDDNINHPSHYESGKYECIEVMEEVFSTNSVKSFCLCNAFKYLYRCMHKHTSPDEDIKKAVWYLNKFLKLEESRSDD